jgi:cell division transport system permease protein
MVVYMPLLADKAAEQALLQKIQSLPEVASVKIKTKEEALQELQQQEGMKDVLAYLPQNPLPTVLEVLPESRDLTEWKHLQKKIQGLSFVEEVRLSMV